MADKQRNCPECGCYVPEGFPKCPSCGKEIPVQLADDGFVTVIFQGEEIKTYIQRMELFPAEMFYAGRLKDDDMQRSIIKNKRRFTLMEV